jgi:MoCo/4Fe-4S cofactor protein with predicted Tat translocation signal
MNHSKLLHQHHSSDSTPSNGPAPMDIAALRAKLSKQSGHKYWRSLEEAAQTPEFHEWVTREFPAQASEWKDGNSRREFLKLMAASLALAGLTSCTRQPLEAIVPYATAMPFNRSAIGLLVETHEGRPTKIEGNPLHPMSNGATNIFAQASILDLYDPDRSRSILHRGQIRNWNGFATLLRRELQNQERVGGRGIRVLSEPITSPSMAAQRRALLDRFPQSRWYTYDPLAPVLTSASGQGLSSQPHYDFSRARVILSIDSDFLFSHPAALANARAFSQGRRPRGLAPGEGMNRLYTVECTPTITGAASDHRLPLEAFRMEDFCMRLLRAVGGRRDVAAATFEDKWLAGVARDLSANPGRSLVIAGEFQPTSVRSLARQINQALGNVGITVRYRKPPEHELNSPPVEQLVEEMRGNEVEFLLMLGGNPAFDFPVDFELRSLLARVPLTIRHGLFEDETSGLSQWHIPATHYLESWSDVRAWDGTVSIVQPVIRPLFGGKNPLELLELFISPLERSAHEIVRAHWRESFGRSEPEFERIWRKALHDGLFERLPEETKLADAEREVSQKKEVFPQDLERSKPVVPPESGNLELVFRPDPTIWDGRFANNAWLRELPHPITKISWENAALISPVLAEELKLKPNEGVVISVEGGTLEMPVVVMPGQAARTVTLHLGQGRERTGRVGTGMGRNTYTLRSSASPWTLEGIEVRGSGRSLPVVTTQHHQNIDNSTVYRAVGLEEFHNHPEIVHEMGHDPQPGQTLYRGPEYPGEHYAWGMTIDLTACIGCNACVVACQSENNIPVVGREQVAMGREMYWLRVDAYYKGDLDRPQVGFQPVPCMHCENAPCEVVCPVEATVHDAEGLNLQVYNRCIGTRYCSNNCPYKVRRFNFLEYTPQDVQAALHPMRNPDVTVRSRGVMEKCTYCIQRISRSRIEAKMENRRILDGEVVTACQQACPTEAIVFGDLGDKSSRVSRLKATPLNYAMLGELNTRPRTSYLAKVRNLNPAMPGNEESSLPQGAHHG